jgi:superoxide dismutase, Fe-Mn family
MAVRFPRITKEQLKERLDRGDALILLDVRLKYPYEHSTVRLPGALRVMPDDVASVSLPRDREVVVYDADPGEIVGARAAQILVRQGHQVCVLKGGLPDWVTANYPTEPKEPRAKPAESAPAQG